MKWDFPSTYGEDAQAAAFVYAYYIAENDPYIDAMILSRETDAAEEVSQGLALGLSYKDGRKKMIYDVFKYIDTDQAEKYTQFALDYIGISDWSEVIDMQKDQDGSRNSVRDRKWVSSRLPSGVSARLWARHMRSGCHWTPRTGRRVCTMASATP